MLFIAHARPKFNAESKFVVGFIKFKFYRHVIKAEPKGTFCIRVLAFGLKHLDLPVAACCH